ncbi:MAG: energy-coupling factor transporter ATPase [Chloroflexi bacterium]|nr:energy-coupling factor transporter ATPase [Chloroflexota bacterium]
MSHPIIRLEKVHFSYEIERQEPIKALNGVDLEVRDGEYLVILGHNGSGKSTLAKHLNALLAPTEGDVWVRDWNTRETQHMRDIRTTVGMVFQTPDNQIVATIVEEDVAFGPENLGLPHDEIVRRVDWALEQVGMTEFRHRAPHLLSGGQKQRVCIAGMLAMRPDVLVLDESTAMLDPIGRKDVLSIAQRLNRQEGVTIVAITHFMEEAIHADRVVIMENGRIEMEGTPREVFSQVERLRELQMDVPPITRLALALHERHPDFPAVALTIDEFVDAFRKRVTPGRTTSHLSNSDSQTPHSGETVISMQDVGHYYMLDTPLEVKAVEHVNIDLHRDEVLGIIGHTGSGKSTIIQHMNALLKPHEGVVQVFGEDTTANETDIRAIRRRVGLAFQHPEIQLFERFVGDDVAYGPRNLGLPKEEVRERVREAMEAVGLGFEEFKDRMTFSLSGGEKRRAALAGILALRPEVLVLDEPTAGLDPVGRRQLLELIHRWHEKGITLVMVSHNMEELAEMAGRLYVVANGTTLMNGTAREIFSQVDALQAQGLDAPTVTLALHRLADEGLISREQASLYTVEAAAEFLGGMLNGKL